MAEAARTTSDTPHPDRINLLAQARCAKHRHELIMRGTRHNGDLQGYARAKALFEEACMVVADLEAGLPLEAA